MKFRSKILESGEHKFENSRKWIAERLKTLAPGNYIWEIKKYHKQRTLPMNAYLHGVLIPCFREALNGVGYDEVKTDEQCKLIIKAMFLKRQVTNKETGEILEYIQDTSALNTFEMATLFEEVWKFSAEHLGYVIPSPNSQLEMDFV